MIYWEKFSPAFALENKILDTIEDFASVWFEEIAKQGDKNLKTISAVLDHEIVPAIGKLRLKVETATYI